MQWPGTWGSWLDTFSTWSKCVCCVFIGNEMAEGKGLGLVWFVCSRVWFLTGGELRSWLSWLRKLVLSMLYRLWGIWVVRYWVRFRLAGLTR